MTHDTPIRVDHVGIAVESISTAEPVLSALGCEKLTEEEVEGRFRWAYYQLGSASRLELIEPTSEESFLTDFLDHHGPGLHHVTLEVADIESVIEEIEAAGLRVVEYEEYDDWTEAFVSPTNPTGALFQLMEYHEGYAEKRPSGSELFIGGQPLGRADDSDTTDTSGVSEEVREQIVADPYCATLGIDLVALGDGFARTELDITDDLLNFHGTSHGGAISSLADAAFAAASNSHDETALALETNISYLDSVETGTTLVATAEETHMSRRTAEYEVVVTADDERIATFRGRVYRP